jgi:hypothetical protein
MLHIFPTHNPQRTTNELPLLLLVFRVRADHPDDPLAADDLAVFTDSFNAASDFHGFLVGRTPSGIVESSILAKIKTVVKTTTFLESRAVPGPVFSPFNSGAGTPRLSSD